VKENNVNLSGKMFCFELDILSIRN